MDSNKEIVKEISEENTITEGKAFVYLENKEKTFSAFYNPAQEFNRDLSIACISTYMNFSKYKPKKMNLQEKRFNICEPLSATGLRAIRYYLELNNNKIGEIVASDMDKKAEEMMQKNTKHNNIEINTDNSRFKIYCSEASRLLYSHPKHFDIIDLDPYGTAIPLLDSAIHALPSGGLLCVTFTDMPVLCGNYQETCYYKYSSISAKKPYCHEMAIRMSLFSISTAASRYKRCIKPLLSINANFYVRLFIIIYDSAEDCKSNCLKHGYVFQCERCQNRIITPLAYEHSKKGKSSTKIKFNNLTINKSCHVCESEMAMYGPFWIDDIYDNDFIDSLLCELQKDFIYLKYKERIEMTLACIKEELPLQKQIFSYDYSILSRDIRLSCPKLSLIKGGLDSLGYKLVQMYYDPNLVKTDCPPEILYQVMCCYKKEVYTQQYFQNVNENEFVFKILSKEVKVKPNFIELENSNKNIKFLENPLPNWGPKARAKLKKKRSRSNSEMN